MGKVLNWSRQGTTTIVTTHGWCCTGASTGSGRSLWAYEIGASAKFTGKRFPNIWDWLEEIANWLELSPCTPDQWINIAGTRLEKNASSWFRAEKASIRAGRDVLLAKNPSTGTAQQRLFLVLKVVLHAVVVISEVLRLSTKSRCSRCCRHISTRR